MFFMDRGAIMNDKQASQLALYITAYIEEESERGNKIPDYFMIREAIEAWLGGAR